MCHAIPGRVEEIFEFEDEQLWGGASAMLDIGGVKKKISLALVDGITVGEYVIVHTGFALSRLNEEEARKTLERFAESESGYDF